MPMSKEERKEYDRLKYIRTKKLRNEQSRLNYLNNKEKHNEKNRLNYIKNKDEINKRHRLYNQTEQGKKIGVISNWKIQGILCFDWDLLYDIFLKTTNCEFCNVELKSGLPLESNSRCLDHDHSINDKFNIRGVLCLSCNAKDVLTPSSIKYLKVAVP